jgi:hypothetical protein
VTLAHLFHKKSFEPHLSVVAHWIFSLFFCRRHSAEICQKKKRKRPLVLIGESLPLSEQSCPTLLEKQVHFWELSIGNILK